MAFGIIEAIWVSSLYRVSVIYPTTDIITGIAICPIEFIGSEILLGCRFYILRSKIKTIYIYKERKNFGETVQT